MRVLLNGEAREVRGPTLELVLQECGLGAAVVATAVNGEFVPAPSRASTVLADGDALEALAPMQGG